MLPEENLTSHAAPLGAATITVRVVKSFVYRNVRNMVFQGYDLEHKTAQDLLQDSLKRINEESTFRALRGVTFDTFKIYSHAHGTKTMNLVINLDHDDDWVLDLESDKPLTTYGIENETEISLFNAADYQAFKDHPQERWL